jgi:hypothetical protein
MEIGRIVIDCRDEGSALLPAVTMAEPESRSTLMGTIWDGCGVERF